MKTTTKNPKHQSINKISPLAPKSFKAMNPIQGVSIYTYCANLYNYNRLDVLLFLFDEELNIAEVSTHSKTRSITIDWNEKNLKKGNIIRHKNIHYYSSKSIVISSSILIESEADGEYVGFGETSYEILPFSINLLAISSE